MALLSRNDLNEFGFEKILARKCHQLVFRELCTGLTGFRCTCGKCLV